MPISIYPPILSSSQPAFVAAAKYIVYFNLNTMTSWNDIQHIQLRVMKQTNNKSIVNTSLYPDGSIYKDKNVILHNKDVGAYEFPIMLTDLQEAWQPGYLYKIQARFGSDDLWLSTGEKFADWKKRQIDESGFSEWSTVMLVKVIDKPTIQLLNVYNTDPNTSQQMTELSLTPEFTGIYTLDSGNKEGENSYKFDLFDGSSTLEEDLLETSGWIQHNEFDNSADVHRFKRVLINNHTYTVKYYVRTVNGYEGESAAYTFTAKANHLNVLNWITLEVEDDAPYCTENGCVNVYLKTDRSVELTGNYVLSRACEDTNFTIYEDIKFMLFSRTQYTNRALVFRDFSIESGVKYKYAFQYINAAGLRTDPLYEDFQPTRCVNFEYAYLLRDDIQLKLKFDNTVQSFKHTILQSKQDTLGGKYPYLSRNGRAYYAEFPIGGLISFALDEDETFFKEGIGGYYYKDQLVIPSDKYYDDTDARHNCDPTHPIAPSEAGELSVFNRNLTHNNIFIERKFREKVEEFLNDFDCKLYKSPTEGNIVVALQNVSLSPVQTLGRMIYSFSATAYEVLDNTLENLNDKGIITIGAEEQVAEDLETFQSFGQLSGYFEGLSNPLSLSDMDADTPDNLTNLIAQQEATAPEGYINVVKRIKSISIDQYPKIDTNDKLLELEAERAEIIAQGGDPTEIDEQIALMKKLAHALDTVADITNIVLVVDGTEILVRTGKPYYLKNLDSDQPVIQLKYSSPIILNYVCDMVQQEDNSKGVIASIESSRVWGQISGIFTETDAILRSYDYMYRLSPTYRIYNPYPEGAILDKQGNVIVDNTTTNVYKSKNIKAIIEEEVKKQIEDMYPGYGKLSNYDEAKGVWYNKYLQFNIKSMYSLDIETDPGVILYIGQKSDGSDRVEISVGPTGRYVLHPQEDAVNYIAFKNPQYGVINYKCYTTQQIMKVED